MSGPTPRRPGRPALLTRERLARAAFDLVDAEGVGALTIGRLARELGVSPMTIYGYVASKDDIVLTLPELLFADMPPADLGRDLGRPWTEVLEEVFLAVYRRFVGHRHVTQAIAAAPVFGRAQAQIIERVLHRLADAGFSTAEAFELQRTLATYTLGFALFSIVEAQAGARRPRSSWTDELDVADFPHVARIADRLGADVDETQFLAGLRRILGALPTRPGADPTPE